MAQVPASSPAKVPDTAFGARGAGDGCAGIERAGRADASRRWHAVTAGNATGAAAGACFGRMIGRAKIRTPSAIEKRFNAGHGSPQRRPGGRTDICPDGGIGRRTTLRW